MLDYYLHTAYAAAIVVQPHLEPITLSAARPGVIVAELSTAAHALRWFTEESSNALAAAQLASPLGLDATTWQFAWTLGTFLLRQGRWHDHAAAWQAGLDAATRDGDAAGQAYALHGLGEGLRRSGRHSEAGPLLWRALRAFENAGKYLGSQAGVHNSLACQAEVLKRPADMLRHALRARELYRAAAHPAGQVWVLNNIGSSYAYLGDYRQAMSYCERALAGTSELGTSNWQAASWDSLGYIHHKLGDHQRAVSCFEQSIQVCQEIGDRFCETISLENLGGVWHDTGDIAAARRTWEQALHILEDMRHPDRERIRVKLR